MKFTARLIVLALFCALQPSAYAETYSNAVLTLNVPDGFEGPISASPGPGAETVGFTKPYVGGVGGTLFQISTYDFRSSLEGMPEEERGNASDYYLGQFLSGVERQRTSFSASKPERVSLGGIPRQLVRHVQRNAHFGRHVLRNYRNDSGKFTYARHGWSTPGKPVIRTSRV